MNDESGRTDQAGYRQTRSTGNGRRHLDAGYEQLLEKVAHLETQLEETRAQFSATQKAVKRFQDQYTLGRGIFIGICSVLGLAGFLVVGVIQDVINHIYVSVEHSVETIRNKDQAP